MKDVLPKGNACVRLQSALSNGLQSRLLKVLKKVLLSSTNKGQWRIKLVADSISRPQLFWGINGILEIMLEHISSSDSNQIEIA